jgi:2-methylcitrate dehydratase PrpD
MFTRVTLLLRDGRTLSAQASFARGSPQRPFTRDELLAKFRECAALALPPARVAELIAAIERIEEAPDVRELLALTRPWD